MGKQDKTPIKVTARYAGKYSVREAASKDGLWLYLHVDDGQGSPWRVEYTPTGQWFYSGSLKRARETTANGNGLRWLMSACRAVLGQADRTAEEQKIARERLAVYEQALNPAAPVAVAA